MVDVRPFRGVRYNPAQVGDLGSVVCPPYDVITPSEQRALYERSPFNIVRLELGETHATDTQQENRYTRAGHLLKQWLAEKMLAQEQEPALYVVREEFPHGEGTLVRQGILARVRLEEFDKGVVLPHERTSEGPKRDRLELMQASPANISPIMALYRDPSHRIAAVLETATATAPAAEATPEEGYHYRLWVVHSPEVLEDVQEVLGQEPLYLADGHHRYETALAYRDLRRAQTTVTGEEAFNFVLMSLIELEDTGLLVLPYHRLLRGLDEQKQAALRVQIERLFQAQMLSRQPGGPAGIAKGVLAELERLGPSQVTMGVVGLYPQGPAVLTLPDSVARRELEAKAPSPALGRCEPWLLQEGVLEPALGIRGEEGAGAVELAFVHEAEEAVKQVMAGEYQVAFLLRAVPLDLLEAVVREGERLPPKSTYFFPKLITGLVLHLLDG